MVELFSCLHGGGVGFTKGNAVRCCCTNMLYDEMVKACMHACMDWIGLGWLLRGAAMLGVGDTLPMSL